MHILVDASNIRKGGGVTHLQEIFRVADLEEHGIDKVTVWAPEETLEQIGSLPRVVRRSHPLIDKGRWHGVAFRKYYLDRLIDFDTDLLWAPGGTYLGSFRPYVTMLRNFLPFIVSERDRFKYSVEWARLVYLRHAQAKSFERADGLIHVSQKAHDVLNDLLGLAHVRQTVIYHGLSERFRMPPREQAPFDAFSQSRPVRILYVSHIDVYKHHDTLISAVARVRRNGMPVELNLVGPVRKHAKSKFEAAQAMYDPRGEWVRWHGEIPYGEVQRFYRHADLCVFMSTCETFGNILLEAMAGGVPILCSNRGALSEVHGGTAVEIDPEDLESVVIGLERLVHDGPLRQKNAEDAFARARAFTWERCSKQTFRFLVQCASRN